MKQATATSSSKKRASTAQCTSVIGSGRGGIVFCTKRHGHDGDHRGFRAQWNETGRVPITEFAVR